MNHALIKKLISPGIYFLFLASFTLSAAPALLSSLTDDPLVQVLPALEARYIDFKKLNYQNGDQLDDLIERSQGEISLETTDAVGVPTPTFLTQLPDSVLYWRLASFTPETNWKDLAAQLEQNGFNAQGLILDLRSNTALNDLAGAAQVAAFFSETNSFFTRENRSGLVNVTPALLPPRLFHLPMVILIDRRTSGAAEALAALLERKGALVIGHATRGRAALFEQQRLSSGQIIRYVTGRIILQGKDLWNHPVLPDIGFVLAQKDEENALVLIAQHHVLDLIHEATIRHRLTEAALIKDEEPETDDYLASQDKKTSDLTPKADPVLIAALDSLKAIHLSQQRPITSASGSSIPETIPFVQ